MITLFRTGWQSTRLQYVPCVASRIVASTQLHGGILECVCVCVPVACDVMEQANGIAEGREIEPPQLCCCCVCIKRRNCVWLKCCTVRCVRCAHVCFDRSERVVVCDRTKHVTRAGIVVLHSTVKSSRPFQRFSLQLQLCAFLYFFIIFFPLVFLLLFGNFIRCTFKFVFVVFTTHL